MSDRKLAPVASSNMTITLASLASSSTLLAGRESTEVDNSTNKYLDYLLSGQIMTGTTSTVGLIEVWVWGLIKDTPTRPLNFTGSDAALTLGSAEVKAAGLRLAASIANNTTSNIGYAFPPISIASLFGGLMPNRFGLFVTHSTVAVLNATGGNHFLSITPFYETIA